MKKLIATILSAFTLCGAFALPTGAANPEKSVTANAETQTACTAVTEGYSALSYGSTLYLCSEKDGKLWQTYKHDLAVAEMRFAENGNLYFLDAESNLFTLSLASFTEGQTATDTQIDCSYFSIQADELYAVNVSFNAIKQQTAVSTLALSDLQTVDTQQFDKIFTAFTRTENGSYALYGSTLYKLSLEEGTYTRLVDFPDDMTGGLAFTQDSVYYPTANKLVGYSLQSLTKSTEESGIFLGLSAYKNDLYLVHEGKVKTYANGILQAATGIYDAPLLSALPTADLKASYENGTPFEVVETAENALLVEVDLENETTPHKSVRKEKITALKIGENENFALISYPDGERGYTTYLVNKDNLTIKPDYKTTYAEPKVGYAVSAVNLSKYPRLDAPCLSASLTRGEKVRILGEIRGLERVYYVVEKGEEIGYLPTTYISDIEGAQAEGETVIFGEDGKADDTVWRLVYILLGGVVVCILVDYLILRKKRDD